MSQIKGQDFIIAPVIFADLVAALSQILQAIPLIGNLFKGSTKHIDFDTCVNKSNAVGAEMMKAYDAFTVAQKHELYVNAKAFYETDVKGRFFDWWGAAIVKDYNAWEERGWLSSERESTYHYIAQPVFYFMYYEDAERVVTTFKERFTDPFNNKVLAPATLHMTDPSGDTPKLETDPAGSGTGLAGLFPVGTTGKILLVAAVIAALYFAFFKK